MFNGTVSENISIHCPTATMDRIIECAKIAGAHDFILELPNGYDTIIGEKGMAVSMFYYRAQKKGIWDEILKMLVKKTRKANGRNDDPTYALIDSQSVKTVYNSEKRGFDGGKNKWTKEAHSNRYYGKYTGCSCSCCKYS